MLQNLFSNQKKTSDYTVLVIEDDEPVRESIVTILREEGYEVVSAKHGQEALSLLDTVPMPATIIMDLMMPEMGGEEFLSRARVRFGRSDFPPVLVLTAAHHGEATANLIEVQDYMPKPFDAVNLLSRVWSMIDKNATFAHS
jgi:two-component system, OmpR family, response regulator